MNSQRRQEVMRKRILIDINELLVAVEWALGEGCLRRERKRLVGELGEANRQLARRMQGLSTLQAIGRSVAALMPLQDLLRRIVSDNSLVHPIPKKGLDKSRHP
jgi:hypothetical protein